MMENAIRFFQRKGIKVHELIEELQRCDPNAEVGLPNVNQLGISGYCVLDHVMTMNLSEVESVVIDNPGEIDNRLLQNKTEDASIVYLGSIAQCLKDGLDNPTENR